MQWFRMTIPRSVSKRTLYERAHALCLLSREFAKCFAKNVRIAISSGEFAQSRR